MKPPPTPLEPLRDELEAFLAKVNVTSPKGSDFDDLAQGFIGYVARRLKGPVAQVAPRVAAYLERARAHAYKRAIPAMIGTIDAAIREVELRPAGGGPDWRQKLAARARAK